MPNSIIGAGFLVLAAIVLMAVLRLNHIPF